MRLRTSTRNRDLRELLQLPIFDRCTRRDLRCIDGLVTRMDVDPGRVLCAQGEIGRECFIVAAGRATVTVEGFPVGAIETGQVIGEIAMLSRSKRRTATVTAQTRMRLLVLSPSQFRSVLSTSSAAASNILRETTRRLASIVEDHSTESVMFASSLCCVPPAHAEAPRGAWERAITRSHAPATRRCRAA